VSRRIFVGDIQGCLAELDSLLERVEFRPGVDELHPVGDVVNRGPDSLGVLRRLRELGAGGVLGNHDVHALRVAAGIRAPGRRDTLSELLASPERDELLAWLAQRPFVRGWDDVLLVHAGVSPTWAEPLEVLAGIDPLTLDERSDFATRVRYCDRDGARPPSDWPIPEAPFVPWYEHWITREAEPRTVVFGHWAREGLVSRERVRGLDTGCVWGRELTAWIAEEDRLVSVPALKVWSPTSLPD
jgi:bis(5'-nucleosyl)-tetraphosphatase (symmetrical)